MKKFLLLLLGSFFLMAGVAMATSLGIVNDNYIGATPTNTKWYGQDVIGEANNFDISRAEISLSGESLIVDIYTGFAGKAGVFKEWTQNKLGIGYGDLFMASQWTPTGPEPFKDDKHDSFGTTKWTYGFALGDQWNNTGGSGILYSLDLGANADNALLTESFMIRDSRVVWREGQEVAVKDTSEGRKVGTGNWQVNTDDMLIRFIIDISNTNLLLGPEIAFHWTQTCGNDVIEGSVPVPEPATMLLLGFGLVGLAVIGRRKIR